MTAGQLVEWAFAVMISSLALMIVVGALWMLWDLYKHIKNNA